MTIRAKFPGKCAKCGGGIAVGDSIDWQKGQGATHSACLGTKTSPKKIAGARRVSAPRVKALREPLEGERSITRPSLGRDDGYVVDKVIKLRGDERYWIVTAVGPKFRDDDSDEWLCSALCRLATDEESAPRRTVETAKERGAALLRELGGLLGVDSLTEERLPEGRDVVIHQTTAGHELYRLAADGSVWRSRSSYDDAPRVWRTTAPRATEIMAELLDKP